MNSKYITIKLPSGDIADILEIRTSHIMLASLKAAVKKESEIMLYYLICEVVVINGKKMSMEVLKEMLVSDSNMIIEVINNQLINVSTQ